MKRAMGPPKEEAGPGRGTTPGPGTPTPHRPLRKASNPDRSGIEFRDWFRRGALDALRLMGRRCRCVDCAAEAEQLAEFYRPPAGRCAS